MLIAFESPGGKIPWYSVFGEEFGDGFGDDPLRVRAGAGGDLVDGDFDQRVLVLGQAGGDEVAGGKDFDVDYGKDTVDVVVVVDFAGYDFLADVVCFFDDGLVGYGCKGAEY